MNFEGLANRFLMQDGITLSTMMGTPCLRYRGDFVAMFFEKEDSLIIKVSPPRANQLIDDGYGNEFNFTKKRFKEWVLIPVDYEDEYEGYVLEAIEYAKKK